MGSGLAAVVRCVSATVRDSDGNKTPKMRGDGGPAKEAMKVFTKV